MYVLYWYGCMAGYSEGGFVLSCHFLAIGANVFYSQDSCIGRSTVERDEKHKTSYVNRAIWPESAVEPI